MRYAALLVIAVLTIAAPGRAATLYVNASAAGPVHDGRSWPTAFGSVADGLAAARSGDEVWTAAGVYNGALTLPAGVHLLGGFAGTETSAAQRNPARNVTVLDGRDAAGTDAATLVTAAPASGSETLLDGFTLQNAIAAVALSNSSPTITGNAFTAVATGIRADASESVIERNTFRDIGADAIIANKSSVLTVRSNTFTACAQSAVTLWDGSSGVIAGNDFSNSPRCISLRGGPTEISGNTFTNNFGSLRSVDTRPGIVTAMYTRVTLTGNALINNGGGVYLSSCTVDARNNRITGNRIGMYLETTNGTIPNNVISANAGVAIGCFNSSPAIVNNTIVHNTPDDGGAVQCVSSSPALANNIIAFNSAGVSLKPNPYDGSVGRPTLSHNDVFGNTGANYTGMDDATGLTGNISADPRLRSLTLGDLHLQPDSPCVDAGDTSLAVGDTDIDGQQRVMGAAVDIGADESDGASVVPQPRIVRVSTTGDDANDGSSWQMAMRTPQAAARALTEHGGEAWVAVGVYTGRLAVPPYAAFYGGFDGTETLRDQRNPRRLASVLDGAQTGPVVYAGARAVAVDGFTIRNGGGSMADASWRYFTGGVYMDHTSAAVTNNVVTGNAGGFYVTGGAPRIENNVIRANGGLFGGVTIYAATGGRVANNTFTGNAVVTGSVFTTPALYAQSSTLAVVGNTVVDNGTFTSPSYSVPPVLQLDGARAGSVLANNIVAFNAAGVSVTSVGAISVRNNCVFGNTVFNYTGIPDQGGRNGNISVDPRIVRAPPGQVHLLPDSPCRDAGDDAFVLPGDRDIDGQPRILGAHVDIGSDESDGALWPDKPGVVRVSPGGNDGASGGSWPAAKRTLQAGIDAVAATGGSVWVAAGVYRERVILPSDVEIYGGFAGSETAREQRDWRANTTVLDGEGRGTVVSILPGAREVVVDGFVVRNGKAPNTGPTPQTGGGIACGGLSTFTIANNRLLRNQANLGGGISVSGGSGLITRNVFMGNLATEYNGAGGGLYIVQSSPDVRNNVFAGNSAGYGGGAYIVSGAPFVVNNTFLGNVGSASLGSADPASGGAVFTANAAPLLVNNIAAYNSSGFSVSFGSPGSATFLNNCVWQNAGGDYVNYTDPTGLGGNRRADPQLLNIAVGDAHISPSSPCRDAGDNSFVLPGDVDMDGQPRIQGGRVDIGADEAGPEAPDVPTPVVFAAPAGSDAADGHTWATAKRTVQAAVDALHGGGEVWVAAGTYPENLATGPFVSLYGGFAGTETARAGRNVAANTTTLDGQGRGTVLTVFGGSLAQAVDGFTIRNGYALSPNVYVPIGAGVSALGAAIALTNSVVTENTGRGVVAGIGSLLQGNTISANTGEGVNASPFTRVIGNVVTANKGGGIIGASGMSATYNRVTDNGDLETGLGSGISAGTYSYTVPNNRLSVISNNIVTGNLARGGGAGVRIFGPANVLNNLIANNTAVSGAGGLSCNAPEDSSGSQRRDPLLVAGNTISGNTGQGPGVGIAITYTVAPVVRDNVVANNTGNNAYYNSYGGGIYVPSNAVVANNTIYGNRVAGPGGGIWAWAASYQRPLIANNIVVANSSGIYATGAEWAMLKNNNVFGNTGADYTEGMTPDPGSISADPLFVSAATGDFHLTSASPCVDAGDDVVVGVSETDMDGQPRIQGRRVDIGADESPYLRTAVNVADAAMALRVAAGLSETSPAGMSFLNADRTGASASRVDLADALRLLWTALGAPGNPVTR